jgi:hypothetical protein
MTAEQAVGGYRTVNAGSIGPPLLMHFGQEQMGDGRNCQMLAKRSAGATVKVPYGG